MGIVPIHGPDARSWVTMYSIGRTSTSIIVWSKITEGSSSAPIPCVASEARESAARFCCAFDELRNSLRPRRTMGEVVSLLEQRRVFLQRLTALQTLIQVAS